MTYKKKKVVMQISRIIVQLLFFILLPSLYIQALNGIKQIYLAVINLSFTSALLPSLVEVIAIFPITMLLGRFFCGWMCAFGSFTDFIYQITGKLFHRKWKINSQVDAVLKYLKYVILAIVAAAIWTLNISIFGTASPWDAFGMLVTVGKLPDLSYVLSNLLIGFLFFILIMIASVFVERFFCRYLCPLGAVFAITSKLRIGKIRKPTKDCGKCRICTNNCAMGIPLYQSDTVKSAECINCMKCVAVCPRANVNYAIADKDVRSLVVSAATVAVITGGYYTTSYACSAITNNSTSISSQATSETSASQIYADGTYEGTGSGFRNGTTTISVTIENDVITDISTVSYEDDRPFYEQASSVVFSEILSSQSADVDSVSGATFSSNGIMEAVTDALSQAKIDNSTSTDSTTADTTIDKTTDTITDTTTDTTTDSSDLMDSDRPEKQDFKHGKKRPKSEKSESDSASSEKASTADSASADTTTSSNNSTSDSATSKKPTTTDSSTASSTNTDSSTTSTGKYIDGTYQGSGTGFRGTTSVTVVVSNGDITSIDVDSYQDDRQFFDRALSTVTSEIIDSQSTNVDSVSGATYSSNGIMEAVADALSSAVN